MLLKAGVQTLFENHLRGAEAERE